MAADVFKVHRLAVALAEHLHVEKESPFAVAAKISSMCEDV